MKQRRSPASSPLATAKSPAWSAARPSRWRRALRDVHAWLVLPHFTPVIVVLAATYGFSALARESLAVDGVTVRLLLAMLGGQLAIGAVNEMVDADLDARFKPAKPIPSGRISRFGARNLTVLSLLVMIGFSASLGVWSLVLCSLGTGAGLAYDLWLKRTLISWLPYLIALPLIPIWVWTALGDFRPRLLILYPLGALAVIGVHVSQALPDAVEDRAAGIRSVTSMLGESRSLLVCWTSTLTAPFLASVLAMRLTNRAETVWIGSLVVAALVTANAFVYLIHRRAGIVACFPLISMSTALMGFVWVLAAR